MHTQDIENMLNKEGIDFTLKEPLNQHTTFKIGGAASVFCRPSDQEQLVYVVNSARECGFPFYFIGMGSNLLFSDEGYKGVIVHIGKSWSKLAVNGNTLTAQAGASLRDACLFAQQNGLSGMEFAYGIPGSIGGAIYMNAGAYSGETKDIVTSVTALDQSGAVHKLSVEELEFGYRSSVFQRNKMCILSADFKLETADKNEILKEMLELMQKRADKQPLDIPSAGSVFKRPVGAFAGALIDQCGLRGYRINDAAISEKHCGFIVNLGNATARDVMQLADFVSKTVKEKTGYTLEKEIRVIE